MDPLKLNYASKQEEYQRRLDHAVKLVIRFKNETDTGLAIVGAAVLDEKLKTIIRSFLIQGEQVDELFKGDSSPLATFSARISIAYALGLISAEEYKNCQIMRKIRNDFAHGFDLKLSFSDNSISDRCNNLSISKLLRGC